jgi:nucleotide-binding universal stress UspA family protein
MSALNTPSHDLAPHPVPHRVDDPWRHILVATDARPESMAAVNRALELARRDRADLTILVAWPADPIGVRADWSVPHAIDVLIERGRAAGLRVGLEVRRGAAGQAIVDAAHEVGADLVVVGRHGRSHDLPAGPTTCGYVLTHSDRPVLVVQPWAPRQATS